MGAHVGERVAGAPAGRSLDDQRGKEPVDDVAVPLRQEALRGDSAARPEGRLERLAKLSRELTYVDSLAQILELAAEKRPPAPRGKGDSHARRR